MRPRIFSRGIALGLLSFAVLGSISSIRSQTAIPQGCDSSTVDAFGPQAAARARAFLAELQAAVTADDKRKVAFMTAYPLRVFSENRKRIIRNRSEFLASYNEIFTPSVKESVIKQSAACLFGNWQGAMAGRGAVWFQESDGVFKIITVNEDAPRAKPRAARSSP